MGHSVYLVSLRCSVCQHGFALAHRLGNDNDSLPSSVGEHLDLHAGRESTRMKVSNSKSVADGAVAVQCTLCAGLRAHRNVTLRDRNNFWENCSRLAAFERPASTHISASAILRHSWAGLAGLRSSNYFLNASDSPEIFPNHRELACLYSCGITE